MLKCNSLKCLDNKYGMGNGQEITKVSGIV